MSSSALYSSALWGIRDLPGSYLYRTAHGEWILEIGEKATGVCPSFIERELKAQKSSLLFLGQGLKTRRSLLDRLKTGDPADKADSALAQLID